MSQSNKHINSGTQKQMRYQRPALTTGLLYALMAFLLILSCPVKSSLKNMAGQPNSTIQHNIKSSAVLGQSSNSCVSNISSSFSQTHDSQPLQRLLPVFFSAIFTFLVGYSVIKHTRHPNYGSKTRILAVPLYLQHNRFLI